MYNAYKDKDSINATKRMKGLLYVGKHWDLNTNHLNTKNFWILDFLKFVFQMVGLPTQNRERT